MNPEQKVYLIDNVESMCHDDQVKFLKYFIWLFPNVLDDQTVRRLGTHSAITVDDHENIICKCSIILPLTDDQLNELESLDLKELEVYVHICDVGYPKPSEIKTFCAYLMWLTRQSLGRKEVIHVATTEERDEFEKITHEMSLQKQKILDRITQIETDLRAKIVDNDNLKSLQFTINGSFYNNCVGSLYHIEVEHLGGTQYIYDFFIPTEMVLQHDHIEDILSARLADECDEDDTNNDCVDITDRDEGYTINIRQMSQAAHDVVMKDMYKPKTEFKNYRTMVVIIDENEPDPERCCRYAGESESMPSGSSDEATKAWQEFFGYRPCLLKVTGSTKTVTYLDPDDYRRLISGRRTDIFTGNDGDVMIEFPRRGIRIERIAHKLIVSMTDNPDNPNFTYYAHKRGDEDKDNFYLGAYLANSHDCKLNSLLSNEYLVNVSIGDFRKYAHNKGPGYEIMTFYQFMYLQTMYILQYKNLNSKIAIGNKKVKLFGIEDLWGEVYQLIDGFGIDDKWQYCVTTDGFNDKFFLYDKIQIANPGQLIGFMDSAFGTSELGFIPISAEGSKETYYCDLCTMNKNSVPIVGGLYNQGSFDDGIFDFRCSWHPTNSDDIPYEAVGARLSYY